MSHKNKYKLYPSVNKDGFYVNLYTDNNVIRANIHNKILTYDNKFLDFRSYYIGNKNKRKIRGVHYYESDSRRYFNNETILNNEIKLRETQLMHDLVILKKLYDTKSDIELKKKMKDNELLSDSILKI